MSRTETLTPHLKIDRAKTHIENVKSQINEYTSTVPTNLVRAPHPYLEDYDVLVARVEGQIPNEIPLVIGDAVHNLRTALDHLVCDVSAMNGKSRKGISFPFFPDVATFQLHAWKRMQKLPVNVQKCVRRLAPYRGGDDLLYALSELDKFDKHRSILLCNVYLGEYYGTFSCDHPFSVGLDFPDTLENGVHLFTIPSAANFEQDLSIKFSVAFSEPYEIAGRPVIDVLNDFSKRVERVVRLFERWFL